MRYLTLVFLCFPLLLTAQKTCFGSFEVFGAAGLSGGVELNERWTEVKGPAFSGRFGFGASFKVGDRTLIRTSAQYADYGNRWVSDTARLRFGSQHDGMGGFDPSLPSGEPGLSLVDLRTRLMYIEGHVSVRQYFRSRSRLRPFGELGLGAASFVTRQEIGEKGTPVLYDSDGFRGISPVARGGVGADVMLSDNFGLYGMAVAQYHLRNVRQRDFGGGVSRPWQLSLEVGVRVFVDNR